MAEPSASEVDVLIIGAGPAGLMLALWMARLGVNARIIDKRTSKVFSGHADGIQVRTLEILDSFGIGERVWKEANRIIEVCFWNPDENGRIRRDNRVVNGIPGLSRFSEVVLHQGRMEAFFLDAIRASYSQASAAGGQQQQQQQSAALDAKPIQVERMVIPTALEIDASQAEDADAYPLTVTLRHLREDEVTPRQVLSNLGDGMFRSNLIQDDVEDILSRSAARDAKEELVRCRYVVGCDGAHSWTRKTLGIQMDGEMTDFIWGVLDIVPITDFPDIRQCSMIHSASSGSLMVIPRENKIVRLYIQLTEVSAGGGRVDRSRISPEMIIKAARKIMSPYTLDYHYCDWWTAYQIGQRVGTHFSQLDRVFLAGDAVHTHSPKAGQGMNVSMQDAYNLGWKIGLVCKGVLQRRVLQTYEHERKMIARQLIEFDRKFSRLFSGQPAKDILGETGVSMEEFAEAFRMSHMFMTGVGINYLPSVLTAKPPDDKPDERLPVAEATDTTPGLSAAQSTTSLAANCKPGTRFPCARALSQADARPWELQQKMPSDGRFRMVVFGGDVSSTAQRERVNSLGAWVGKSLLPRFPTVSLSVGSNPHGGTVKFKTETDPSVIDVLLVHSARRDGVEILRDLDNVFHPFDAKIGWDYEKVFVDNPSYNEGDGKAYENLGIDRAAGAVVVVRPDGYVGLVTSVDEQGAKEVERWFEGVLQHG
ncbi:hypothetical protein DL770_004007 [Monosporascus sp. CRB-9-2]|nr:hypothetical protein DL770_004007 [Monosporascus sp. CRB-9-2]